MDTWARKRYDQIFPKPKYPENTILWRYLATDPTQTNVDKFRWLIQNSQLYLTKVSNFKDSLEGTMTRRTRQELEEWDHTNMGRYDEQMWTQVEDETRSSMFASCWHISETENPQMYAEYCGHTEGILIKTTFTKLQNQCEAGAQEKFFPCVVRYVRYRDYFRDNIGNAFCPFTHKDIVYWPEREARVLSLGNIADSFIGMPISPVDLIESIRVHPLASQKYYDSILRLIENHAPTLLDRLQWSELREKLSVIQPTEKEEYSIRQAIESARRNSISEQGLNA